MTYETAPTTSPLGHGHRGQASSVAWCRCGGVERGGPACKEVDRFRGPSAGLGGVREHRQLGVGTERHRLVGQLEPADDRMVDTLDPGVVVADVVLRPAERNASLCVESSPTDPSGHGRTGCGRPRRAGPRRRRRRPVPNRRRTSWRAGRESRTSRSSPAGAGSRTSPSRAHGRTGSRQGCPCARCARRRVPP